METELHHATEIRKDGNPMSSKVEESKVGLSEGQQDEGNLVCRHCGRELPVTPAMVIHCRAQGWRKCCGVVMRWVIRQEGVDRDQE